MIQLTDNHWAVEVPEGLINPQYQTEQSFHEIMEGDGREDELVIRHTGRCCGSPTEKIVIDIPPGTWEIVCTSKDCTEAIAEQIVDKEDVFYKCYAGNRSHISPLRSLFCLMDEKGCDLNKTYLILKNTL